LTTVEDCAEWVRLTFPKAREFIFLDDLSLSYLCAPCPISGNPTYDEVLGKTAGTCRFDMWTKELVSGKRTPGVAKIEFDKDGSLHGGVLDWATNLQDYDDKKAIKISGSWEGLDSATFKKPDIKMWGEWQDTD